MRDAWEYQIIFLPRQGVKTYGEFDEQMRQAGLNGWEAVSMNDDRVLLKRRLF